MAESTPERSAYLPPHARSQASTNWRMKDDSPKPENTSNFRNRQDRDSPRNEQSPRFRQDRGQSNDDNVIAAGCRLYVGNLLYTASREDVEALFTSNGFNLTGMSMSVDPFTNRNPSYCFVDFETADEASRAMETMNGKELLGREIRVHPGVRRQQGTGERRIKDYQDGRGQTDSYTDRAPRQGNGGPAYSRTNRTDGVQHSANVQSQGLRLFVGGLPRIEPQSACESTVREMFNVQGLEVAAISKLISPHPSKSEEPGNHYYCFVDMNSQQDIDVAVEKLNGLESEWGALRVGRAKENREYRKPNQGYERRERDGPRAEERGSWR